MLTECPVNQGNLASIIQTSPWLYSSTVSHSDQCTTYTACFWEDKVGFVIFCQIQFFLRSASSPKLSRKTQGGRCSLLGWWVHQAVTLCMPLWPMALTFRGSQQRLTETSCMWTSRNLRKLRSLALPHRLEGGVKVQRRLHGDLGPKRGAGVWHTTVWGSG